MKKYIYILLLAGLIIVPVVLIILPASFFDHGQSVCLSKSLLHTECLGCGMTRAFQHLIHFEFSKAYSYNKLSVVVFPCMLVFWIMEFRRIRKKLKNLSN